MIKNEQQYRTMKVSVRAFRDALEEIRGRSEQADPILRQAQIQSLESEIAELSEQIEKYEAIRSGRVPGLDVSFDDLAEALVLARAAAGLTQSQLAERVGVGPQLVQRYEAQQYERASYARLKQVLRALGVEVRLHLSMPDRKSSTLLEQQPQDGLVAPPVYYIE